MVSRRMNSPAMKRTIVHFVVALCVASLVRADQTVQSVQQALKDQGFYYGSVTGDKSSETTAAVRRYQIRNGLQVTGEMDPQTLHSLNVNSNSAASSQSTSKPAVAQQNTNTVRPVETPRLDQNSVQQPPGAPDRQPEMNATFPETLYRSESPRMNKRMVIAEVQRQLISRGYYQGRADGRHGRRTALALRAFQFGSGLPPSGHLDTGTLNALGLSDANLASMEPAARQYETWVPVTKFKHGKWKVKWKKYHREDRDELAHEGLWDNGNEQGHVPDQD
jgi:peptidoglycan hydrolase-like protein with peptidoglycan-binding domain